MTGIRPIFRKKGDVFYKIRGCNLLIVSLPSSNLEEKSSIVRYIASSSFIHTIRTSYDKISSIEFNQKLKELTKNFTA